MGCRSGGGELWGRPCSHPTQQEAGPHSDPCTGVWEPCSLASLASSHTLYNVSQAVRGEIPSYKFEFLFIFVSVYCSLEK